MILLDAAHNPHGAAAAAAALEDSFAFSPLIGVLGMMADKDHEGVLGALEPHLAHVVCTQATTERALPADLLAVTAREVFGPDRVSVEPRLADAIDLATTLAEAGEALDTSIGTGAVLVTGSVVTVGEARALLRRRGRQP
jgi:dihydrofolate synthase/folylpolyglutamate synthase